MFDQLASLDKDIRIAIIGCGAMGKGLLYQSLVTPGIRCVGVADLKVEKIHGAAAEFKLDSRLVDSSRSLANTIDNDVLAVCEDGGLLAEAEQIDVLIDASGAIFPAKKLVETALLTGKHVIMMNSEADLAFGPDFLALAKKNKVVYTSSDGDQPAVIAHLINEISAWGMDLVMAGNIKGFLDRYVTPDSIRSEAEKRDISPRICTAMTDGTKLNVEMALLANAFDLRAARPGMLGLRAKNISQVFELFDLDSLLSRGRPVVDYVLGAEPSGGVFVIGHCRDTYQARMLKYYKMGEGPYYLFYRPYHLCHIETMRTVAWIILDKRGVLQPDFGYKVNVYAYAKKDLKAGKKLDGIGGYTCYGLIENVEENNNGLPIALSNGFKLKRDIKKDQRICDHEVKKCS